MNRLSKPPDIPDDSDIAIQIIDWFIPEQAQRTKFIDYEEQPEYDIHIYGVTEDNYTIQLVVKGFMPYFYVKCPENMTKSKVNEINELLLSGEYEYEAIKTDWKTKKKTVQKRVGIPKRLREHFQEIKMVKKYDFWGFHDNEKCYFLKIYVKSFQLMRIMKDIFKEYKLYESNIDPFLRFIHVKDIQTCGWITVNSENITPIDDMNISQYKFEVDYTDVFPIEKNTIGSILIASFDIECTSSHGDFPLAKKDYKKLVKDLNNIFEELKESCNENGNDIQKVLGKMIFKAFKKEVNWGSNTINRLYAKKEVKQEDIDKIILKIVNLLLKEENDVLLTNLLNKYLPELEGDPIIQIGTTVHKFGSDEILYKNIITLNTCDSITDVEVIQCENERDVILKWKEVLKKINPDILTGYNILGFDFKYIYDRTLELKIDEKFRDGLGRTNERDVPFITNKMFSSAMGEVVTSYYDMEGILIIDLFVYVRRNMSLESYKLDFVAETIMKENKIDLKPSEIFKRYLGDSNDRKVIAEYCIKDCMLVNRLIHKMKIIENNFGMGNVCYVPAKYIFHRGQTIKSLSLVAYECQKRNLCIPVINKADNDFDESYEGAIVLDPQAGIYMEDPIVVFDYSSLYPSSMIAENLSHDSCILPEDFPKYVKIEDNKSGKEKYKLNSENPNLSLNVIHDGTKECFFVKDSTKKSTIPDILQKLIKQRKTTRNKIEYKTITLKNGNKYIGILNKNMVINEYNKKEINVDDIETINDTYNEFEKAVFDALQLAYKITANSLYGATGASVSPIYMRDIASCTTATGRNMIILAKNFVEEHYGSETIYGDTDSIFCKFTLYNENNEIVKGKEAIPYAIKLGQKIEKHIYEDILCNMVPQKLAYEKTLWPLILVSKKRYTGMLYEDDPNKCVQKTMGLQIKRRDSAKIVKDVYGGIIDKIIKEQDLEGSFVFLKEYLERIVKGDIDISRLVLSKTLRSSYKDPSKIAHKVLADRIKERDPGNAPQTNDRLPYVYIKNENATLQGDKIETIEYINENNIEIDYLHYITNQIMKPVLQLYELSMESLPEYNKSSSYWQELDEQLKKEKEIYQDDVKRHKRIKDLRERAVKELLFDPYIEKLGGTKKRIAIKKEPIVESIETDLEKKELSLTITASKAKNQTSITCDKEKIVYNEIINKDKGVSEMIKKIMEKYKDKYIIFTLKGHAPYVENFRKFKVTLINRMDTQEEVLEGFMAGVTMKELIPYISRISVNK